MSFDVDIWNVTFEIQMKNWLRTWFKWLVNHFYVTFWFEGWKNKSFFQFYLISDDVCSDKRQIEGNW